MRKVAPEHLEPGMIVKWDKHSPTTYRLMSKPCRGGTGWTVVDIQVVHTDNRGYHPGQFLHNDHGGWTGFLWPDGKARVVNEP